MEQLKPQLMMERFDLSGLPPLSLPDGYDCRSFRTGYDKAWEEIVQASFGVNMDFESEMRANEQFEPERVLFVCHGDKPVATATAWFREAYGDDTGYLHMVGLLPEYAGKGLGLQASLAALRRMKDEGRRKAVLETDDFRLPAIVTYYRLGFVPRIVHENQVARWRNIDDLLQRK